MSIEYKTESLRKLFKSVDDKEHVLPKFQRGFVWERSKQKRLIASFIARLPYGSFLCLEGSNRDFVTRELCYPQRVDIPNNKCTYILDGQQRLSTLRSVFFDEFGSEWEDVHSKIYNKLKNRWFIRVKPHEDGEDIFGYKQLRFKGFDNFTDTDIEDFIEFKNISKSEKERQRYYHPAYPPSIEETYSKARNILANHMADEKVLPLYEVGSSLTNKEIVPLHELVIDKIATEQEEILELTAEDNQYDIDYLFELFAGIESISTREDIKKIRELGSNVRDWKDRFRDHFSTLKAEWKSSVKKSFRDLMEYESPIIELSSDELPRAVAIFEAINSGGVQLSVFDLLVAKATIRRDSDGVDLVSLFVQKIKESITIPPAICDSNTESDDALSNWHANYLYLTSGEELTSTAQNWLVNILSLLCHKDTFEKENNDHVHFSVEHIKREKILSLSSETINSNMERAFVGFCRAMAFLNFKCGIIKASDVRFKLMVVVIACYLEIDDNWNTASNVKKLERWYWVSLFSGRYYSRQNEVCIKDINGLLTGNHNFYESDINKVLNTELFATKESLLRQNEDFAESDVVKTVISQYILSKNPLDFSTELFKLKAWECSATGREIELHHIIPLTEATNLGESTGNIRPNKKHILNSPLNITPISKKANRVIRDRTVANYLPLVNSTAIQTHFVTTEQFDNISTLAEFGSFLETRYTVLKNNLTTELERLNS